MRTALLMAIAVAGCAGSGVDQQGLVPMRQPAPVGQADAGDALMMAVADTMVDLGLARAADALVPDVQAATPDVRPAFPACSSIGFREASLTSCEDRRTRDGAYSCGICGQPSPQPCVSDRPHPNDLPWLCVASCADCSAVVKCTASGCTVVRYEDGGAL